MASIKGMQEKLGWQVIQIYGLTETSPFLTVSKVKPHMKDWPAEEKYRVQTRTGYTMLGVETRVVDEEGKDVPAKHDDRSLGGSINLEGGSLTSLDVRGAVAGLSSTRRHRAPSPSTISLPRFMSY